jgi:hypothetical protein
MQSQPTPPSGVEPKGPSHGVAGKKTPSPGKSGPGGLSGGVDIGANAPGRTDNNGRQDG